MKKSQQRHKARRSLKKAQRPRLWAVDFRSYSRLWKTRMDAVVFRIELFHRNPERLVPAG